MFSWRGNSIYEFELKICQQFFLCFIAVLSISYIITYAQANDLYADRIWIYSNIYLNYLDLVFRAFCIHVMFHIQAFKTSKTRTSVVIDHSFQMSKYIYIVMFTHRIYYWQSTLPTFNPKSPHVSGLSFSSLLHWTDMTLQFFLLLFSTSCH